MAIFAGLRAHFYSPTNWETFIERGIKNTFHFYDEYTYPNIDSTYLQPEKVAEKIIEILNIKLTGNEG